MIEETRMRTWQRFGFVNRLIGHLEAHMEMNHDKAIHDVLTSLIAKYCCESSSLEVELVAIEAIARNSKSVDLMRTAGVL